MPVQMRAPKSYSSEPRRQSCEREEKESIRPASKGTQTDLGLSAWTCRESSVVPFRLSEITWSERYNGPRKTTTEGSCEVAPKASFRKQTYQDLNGRDENDTRRHSFQLGDKWDSSRGCGSHQGSLSRRRLFV